jgi:hypothetical protein
VQKAATDIAGAYGVEVGKFVWRDKRTGAEQDVTGGTNVDYSCRRPLS